MGLISEGHGCFEQKGIDQEQMRFVTHNDVSREDYLSVLRVVRENIDPGVFKIEAGCVFQLSHEFLAPCDVLIASILKGGKHVCCNRSNRPYRAHDCKQAA